MKITVIGNCQSLGVSQCIAAMNAQMETQYIFVAPSHQEPANLRPILEASDLVLTQIDLRHTIHSSLPEFNEKVVYYPRVIFGAFHPDLTYVVHSNEYVCSPLSHYNSKLVLAGYLRGLEVQDTLRLFTGRVYQKVGYGSLWEPSKQGLFREGKEADFPLEEFFSDWWRSGCFMYSINHPRLVTLSTISRSLLQRLGVDVHSVHPEDYLADALANSAIWPLYPEIASAYGLKGDYAFKLVGKPEVIGLRRFVEESYEAYSKLPRDGFEAPFLQSKPFQELFDSDICSGRAAVSTNVSSSEEKAAKSSLSVKANPYRNLPPHHFWRKSVESVPFSQVDPVVKSRFTIGANDRVASAGSCFAQHISRELQSNGFNYFATEAAPPEIPADLARQRNYGVFSARYGNIYTVRQLVQLFERAYGSFVPVEQAWTRPDGRYADPFRPQVEPEGFGSIDDLEASRQLHFAAVRELFERLDVFIFTLGLTEAWCSSADGAVFPMAPGVVAGEADFQRYRFVNFSVADVAADMTRFLKQLWQVNPDAKIILTVSPVPLVATYEDRHVITATTYSKAVLRVAADEIVRANERVEYFPSYEIITSPFNRGAYFDDDARSVRKEGVEHVMRLFLKHCTTERKASPENAVLREIQGVFEIICDEEKIDSGVNALR